jgi:ketosteroid isomerase-like protein
MAEHPNTVRHRQGHEAFSGGDTDTLTELIAEDTLWHWPGRSPVSGDCVGRDAAFARFEQLGQLSGGTARLEDHDFLGNDEHSVALGRLIASREGKTLDSTFTEVCHWRDGKIVERWMMVDDQHAYDEFWS